MCLRRLSHARSARSSSRPVPTPRTRQDATVDTPHIDVLPGQTVRIAIEKKTVYVKDGLGKEHKLSLRKQTPLERVETAPISAVGGV